VTRRFKGGGSAGNCKGHRKQRSESYSPEREALKEGERGGLKEELTLPYWALDITIGKSVFRRKKRE